MGPLLTGLGSLLASLVLPSWDPKSWVLILILLAKNWVVWKYLFYLPNFNHHVMPGFSLHLPAPHAFPPQGCQIIPNQWCPWICPTCNTVPQMPDLMVSFYNLHLACYLTDVIMSDNLSTVHILLILYLYLLLNSQYAITLDRTNGHLTLAGLILFPEHLNFEYQCFP